MTAWRLALLGGFLTAFGLLRAAPANDNFANAAELSGAFAQTAGTNVDATKETGEPNHAGLTAAKSVWWTWTAPADGSASVAISEATFTPALAVYTGTAVDALSVVGSNWGSTPSVSFTAVAGTAYRIAVDGFGGATGTFTLTLATPPANDNFAAAIALAGSSVETTGHNLLATKETGEPNHAGNTGGKSVWWTWTAPSDGLTYADTVGSTFNTLLAVYTGDSVNALTLVASDDNSGGNFRSALLFNAVAGTTYRFAVDGLWGQNGGITLRIGPPPAPPANDSFANATLISGATATAEGPVFGATKEAGEPDHSDLPGGCSVWWKWVAPATSAVEVNHNGSSFPITVGLLAVYTGEAVGALTPVAVNHGTGGHYYSATGFQAVAGTTYLIALDAPGGWAKLNLLAATPVDITSFATSTTQNAGTNLVIDVGVTGTPPYTCQWSRNGTNLQNVAGRIQDADWRDLTIVNLQEHDEGTYVLNISNLLGSDTFSGTALTVNTPAGWPSITGAPAGQTVTEGASPTFSVTAAGTEPFTYQWKKDNVNLADGGRVSGATTATLTLTGVLLADAGGYTVLVSNGVGSVLSSPPAVLTVQEVPKSDQTITFPAISDKTYGDAPFALGATASSGLAVTYTVVSGSVTIADGVATITGAGPVTIRASQAGSAAYNPAPDVERSFDVAKATATVTLGNLSQAYDGSPKPVSVTTNPPGLSVDVTYDGSPTAPSALGSYAVVATVDEANYQGSATGTLVIANLEAPAITTPPASQVVTAGRPAAFTVVATGTGPLACQWKRNGFVIPGATGTTLDLTSVTYSDRGYYQVTVTNAAGSATAFFHVNVLLPRARLGVWSTRYDYRTRIPFAATGVTAVAAGYTHGAALRSDGTVLAWGQDGAATIAVPAGLADVVDIAATRDGTVALRADGTAAGWGNAAAVPPAGIDGLVAIAAGALGLHLGLKSDGTLVQWPEVSEQNSLHIPAGLTNVVAVACGGLHALALKADGTVTAWGENNYGQCNVPAGLAGVVRIAAGLDHSLALKADGTVVAWGRNSQGQCDVPAGLSGVAEIGSGNMSYTSVAVRADGTAVAWGYNTYEQATVPAGMGSFAIASSSMDFTVALYSGAVEFSSRTVALDTPVTLTVSPDGAGPFTYQWTHDGRIVPGADGAALALPPVASADGGRYECTVGGSTGPARWVFFLNVEVDRATVVDLTGATVPAGVDHPVAIAGGMNYSVALQADGRVVSWGSGLTLPTTLRDVVAVSGSYSSLLALKSDGTVISLGPQSVPPPVDLDDVLAISAGWAHGLALRAGGTVTAFGVNGSGQCDVPAGLGEVVAVAAGAEHSLALCADGTVAGWGSNAQYQAAPPPGLGGVIAIAAGDYSSLALRSDGSVIGWGACGTSDDPTVGNLGQVTAVACVDAQGFALKADGRVVSWDNAAYGIVPAEVAGLHNAVAVAPVYGHTLVLHSAVPAYFTEVPVGTASTVGADVTLSAAAAGSASLTYQWRKDGNDIAGATAATYSLENLQAADAGSYSVVLGCPEGRVLSRPAVLTVSQAPTIVSAPSSQVLDAGAAVTLSVSATGAGPLTYRWTRNGFALPGATAATLDLSSASAADRGYYQVEVSNAFGTTRRSFHLNVRHPNPTVVNWGRHTEVPAGLGDVVGVAAGYDFSVALKADGTVAAWGANALGQCSVPAGLDSAVAVAAGYYFSLALKADGTVVAWGYNYSGETNVPEGLRDVVAIAAGGNHSLALKADGTVVAWGNNFSGQSLVPSGLGVVAGIAAGAYHSVALQTDGTVARWGSQTGSPAGLTGAVGVSSRGDANLALRSDGTVAWGADPLGPAGLADVIAVSAGSTHSLALRRDGTLAAWGADSYSMVSGIPVSLQSRVAGLAAGFDHSVALYSGAAPVITTPPASQSVPVFQANVTMSVAASGTLPFTYQWRKNGTDIVGATGATHTFAVVQMTDAGSYEVVVTNAHGSATSAAATLTVTKRTATVTLGSLHQVYNGTPRPVTVTTSPGGLAVNVTYDGSATAPTNAGSYAVVATVSDTNYEGSASGTLVVDPVAPAFTTHPQGQSVEFGASVTFTAAATGSTPWTIQWRRDGTALPGATALSLTLENVQAADAGSYTVTITNDAGTAVSNAAVLRIGSPPTITTPPPTRRLAAGQTATFSVDATGPAPITYQWRHNGRVIAGATGAQLELGAVDYDDRGYYQVLVTNAGGTTSSVFFLNVEIPNATVVAWGWNCDGQIEIPAGLTGAVAIAAGTFHTLVLKSDGTVVGIGRGVWEGTTGAQVPAGLTEVVAIAAADRTSYALKSDGTVVAWGGATVAAGLADVVALAAIPFGPCVALKSDGTVADIATGAPVGGLADITAIASSGLGVLAQKADGTGSPAEVTGAIAFAGGVNHGLAVAADGTVTAWGGNDRGQTDVPAGLTGVAAVAGGYYHSLALKADGTVVGWGSDQWDETSVPLGLDDAVAITAGSLHSVALLTGTVPVIIYSPADLTVSTGSNAVFSLSTGGPAPTGYQWKKDGTPLADGGRISGATTATLTITGAVPADGGSYTVTVANAAGQVESAAGLLDVNDIPPTITTQPAGQDLTVGADATFSVVAGGTAPLAYQWKKGGTPLTDGGRISGAATATLVITDVVAGDAGTYTVTVSNAAGEATSDGAVLSVTLGPVVSSSPAPRQLATAGGTASFTIVASGTGTLTYAWKHNGFIIAGATGATLDLASVVYSDRGYYEVTVTDANGSSSRFFHLNVLVPHVGLRSWGYNEDGRATVPPGAATGVVAVAAAGDHNLALKSDGTVAAWGLNSAGQTDVPAGIADVVAISADGAHNLVLKSDGTVAAWGYNQNGQCNVPGGLADVIAIDAGYFHSLALKTDGTVVAWGSNGFGQCEVPAGLGEVVAVAGGQQHSLALKADGTVVAWGGNTYNQSSVPVDLTDVVAIAAGGSHSMALKADGTVVAWGLNNYGQASVPAGLANVVAIATAGDFSLALKADGTVAAWGAHDAQTVIEPAGLSGAAAIAAGWAHCLAIYSGQPPAITGQPASQTVTTGTNASFSVTATGTAPLAYQWKKDGTPLTDGGRISGATTATLAITATVAGDTGAYTATVSNEFGEATSDAATLAFAVPGPTVSSAPLPRQVATIGEAASFTVVASGTGTLTYAWKHNGFTIAGATGATLELASVVYSDRGYYQVSITDASGTATRFFHLNVSIPHAGLVAWGYGAEGQTVVPAGPHDIVEIAAGVAHSLVLHSDGTILAWGDNTDGRATVPAGLSDVVAISADGGHNLALRSDGSVAAWGYNGQGQCTVPGGLADVIAIDAGYYHSLALRADGTVAAWGHNDNGQSNVPAGLDGVIAVAAGCLHSLALKSDGTVAAWGQNIFNQCDVPAGLTNVVAVAAGGSHSLALKADGTVVAWGRNELNQCNVPAGLTGVVAIVASGGHSLALKADGTLVAWGANDYGQGSVPAGLAGVLAIAEGWSHNLVAYSGQPPAITGQPASQTVTTGTDASFSVTATGTAPLAYQWKKDGTPLADGGRISGATTTTLAIAATVAGDAGAYTVTVSNEFGQATSNAATLAFTVPGPTVTNVTSSTADGPRRAGQDVMIQVTFSAAVTVAGGTPTLTLETGAFDYSVSYWSGSGTATLTFLYVVLSPHTSADLDYVATDSLQLNGATIRDANGSDARLTLPAPGAAGSLGFNKDLVVDTTAPVITSASTASGTYNAGFSYTITASGAPVGFGASGLPGGLGVQPTTGVISGTPGASGSFAVTLSATDLAGNTGTAALELTIAKAPATVTLGGLAATYGGVARAATATTSPAGLAVSFTYDGSAAAPVNAGSYAVVGTIADANHAGSAAGTLVIAKAPLSATADNLTRLAGAANPPLTVSYAGFVNGETVAVLDQVPVAATTATTGSPAGTYPITLSGGADNNYLLTLHDGTLTVVPAGLSATQAVQSVCFAGRTVEIAATVGYPATAGAVGFSVLLPSGWSFVSGTNLGSAPPVAGQTDLLELAWVDIPASPLPFTYKLAVPVQNPSGGLTALGLVLIDGDEYQVVATPDPLPVDFNCHHSADYGRDGRISLSELLRLISLYNYRSGTTRTGEYHVQAGTVDGFAAGPGGCASPHSADFNRDGRLGLSELLRLISLYNYRNGTTRTGEYHAQAGTTDGYATGP